MATISKSANLRFILDGQTVTDIENWQSIGIKASFDDNNTQASIATTEFNFKLASRQLILNHIENGLTNGVGIFEGIPFQIQAFNDTDEVTVFDGHIATYNGVVDSPETGTLQATIVQNDSIDNINERIEALTYGFLYEKGVITDVDFVDVDYVVKPLLEVEEILITFIVGYLMIKELTEQVEKISEDIATISSDTGSVPPNPTGATIYAVASAILRAAYAAIMLTAIINLGLSLVEAFGGIKRTHKGITLKKLLSKVLGYIGYELETDIPELDVYTYLPSNQSADKTGFAGFIEFPGVITNGLPNSTDYGYSVPELFTLCKDLFLAKFAVTGTKVQFSSLNSDFWLKGSTWNMPDVLTTPYSYNTDERIANILLAFATDQSDIYTVTEFTGTNYEVITEPVTVDNEKAASNKGLLPFNFPIALGNRKGSLSALERSMKSVASLLDDAISIFGGNSNYAGQIESRTGILKVSDNNHLVPKLLYIQDGRIPSNNRDLLSARYLWDTYHNYNSFIDNNYQRQRLINLSVKVPFGLTDYLKLANNSYFTDNQGRQSKVTAIDWVMGEDFAIIDKYTQQPYTVNLKQTKIEA